MWEDIICFSYLSVSTYLDIFGGRGGWWEFCDTTVKQLRERIFVAYYRISKPFSFYYDTCNTHRTSRTDRRRCTVTQLEVFHRLVFQHKYTVKHVVKDCESQPVEQPRLHLLNMFPNLVPDIRIKAHIPRFKYVWCCSINQSELSRRD